MFTITQIKEAHSRVKTGADFPKYIQDIKTHGVRAYDTFVSDGHAVFFGENDENQIAEPKYDTLAVAEKASVQNLKDALVIHQNGETDYLTFCKQSADAGVEKWRMDIVAMTCTYYDKSGNVLVEENIPAAK